MRCPFLLDHYTGLGSSGFVNLKINGFEQPYDEPLKYTIFVIDSEKCVICDPSFFRGQMDTSAIIPNATDYHSWLFYI